MARTPLLILTGALSLAGLARADELHRQYSLAFTPEVLDGKTHKLEVRLRQPNLKVRARKTYVARKDVL